MVEQWWSRLKNTRIFLRYLFATYLACLMLGLFIYALDVKQTMAQDDTSPPPVPTLISPTDGTLTNDRTPTFEWSEVTDPSIPVIYRLQIARDSAFLSMEQDWEPLDTTSYTIPWDLWQDRTYYWRVQARDGVGNWSDCSSTRSFDLDATSPPAPNLISPLISINDTTPTFDWEDVTDPSGVTYNLEVTYDYHFPDLQVSRSGLTSSEYTLTGDGSEILTEDIWYWRVKAVDLAGNEGDWTNYRLFNVDTTPPIPPSLNSPADGGFTNTPYPNLNWSWIDDPSGVSYNLEVDDNSDFSSPEVSKYNQSGSNYWVTSPLADKVYYWRVKAVDGAGNEGIWSSQWSFTIDVTKPSVPNLISPDEGVLINDRSPTLDWSDITDDSGVSYWIQLDNNSNFSSCDVDVHGLSNSTYTITWDLWQDSLYYWRVKAEDGAGNEGDWSEVWQFSLDATPPPYPEMELPYHNTWLNDTTPGFNWGDVTEATSYTLEIRYSGSVVLNKTGLLSSEYIITEDEALTAEGEYWWRVAAVDEAGNESWGGDWRFDLDATPPSTPSLNSPYNNERINQTALYLNWNDVGDRHTFSLQIDSDFDFSSPEVEKQNINNPDYTLDFGVGLTEGIWYWRVRAVDQPGNVSAWSSTWSFVVDISPPAAPVLVYPTDGSLTNDYRPLFDWESVTDPSGLNYRIQIDNDFDFYSPECDRDLGSSSEWSLDWDLWDGTWFWRVMAMDKAGNVSDWSTSYVFTIDTNAPPSPGANFPHGTGINNTTPTFDWSDEYDAESYTLEIMYEGVTVLSKMGLINSEYTLTADEALTAEGEYWWRVAAFDEAGNESWGGDWSFILDTTPPPAPSLNSPHDGEMINHPTPGFGWNNVNDPSGVSFILQIDSDGDFSSPEIERWEEGNGYGLNWDEELTEGTWYWRVKTEDKSGNESDWSAVWEFTVQSMETTNITIDPNNFTCDSDEEITIIATLRDSNGNPISGRKIWWELESPGNIAPPEGHTNESGEVFATYNAFGYSGPETAVTIRVYFTGDGDYQSSEVKCFGTLFPVGGSGNSKDSESGGPPELEQVMPPLIVVVGLIGGTVLLIRRRRRTTAIRIDFERKLNQWKESGFDTSELDDRLKRKK